jgi:hypothetical protein
MYRDDTCAVCGESLPPDHFYCREHGAQVDDRLHELGALLARLIADTATAAALTGGVAQETWDWLAEAEPDDPDWPVAGVLRLSADADQIAVDVDTEPGCVRVELRLPLATLLAAVAGALDGPELARLAAAATTAEGANATH